MPRRRSLVVLMLVAISIAPLDSPPAHAAAYDRDRLIAGHLLRRIGFGPTEADIERVLRLGVGGYVDEQLAPETIDDRAALRVVGQIARSSNPAKPQLQWYLRMIYSRRQLLEKTTLFLHKHFATSAANIPDGFRLLDDQIAMFRRGAFGSFRSLLENVTRDRAMLHFLNNDRNDGNATDANGDRVPPNENYAREFLQLFSMGPTKLDPGGEPVLDADGGAVPNYTEEDVREVARALTGWAALPRQKSAAFVPALHDSRPKSIFGARLEGRRGAAGAREVEDVVDLVMRHPSTAPFMARALILDFVTVTPSPAYVRRVADVFRSTDGDMHATLRAMLLDPEFTSQAVVRTQYKTPIEQVIGTYRALSISSPRTLSLAFEARYFTSQAGEQLYFPPNVFSFYAPGDKEALATTFYVFSRDTTAADFAYNVSMFVSGVFDAEQFVERHAITSPVQCVDALSDALLTAELQPAVRAEILAYMGSEVTPVKVRGAAWLVMCAPDFQLN